jgi:hypothetical protein
MTPRMRRDFEARWPDLALRVEGLLKRKGVEAGRRDDILQETALRLIQMWNRVDPARAPSLAVTVALNLLRDESRRQSCIDFMDHVPETLEPVDVEAAGLARIELRRLQMAMSELTVAQRSALLREIGNGNGNNGSSSAEKMLRMRARKKLRAAFERLSAPVLLRLRKTGDLLQVAGTGTQENLLQGLACIGCIAIGLSVAAPQGLLDQGPGSQAIVSERAQPVVQPDSADTRSGDTSWSGTAASTVGVNRSENKMGSATKEAGRSVRDSGDTAVAPSTGDSPDTGTQPAPSTPLSVGEPDAGIEPPDVPSTGTDAPDPGIVGVSPGRVTPTLPDVPSVPSVPLPEPDPPSLPH